MIKLELSRLPGYFLIHNMIPSAEVFDPFANSIVTYLSTTVRNMAQTFREFPKYSRRRKTRLKRRLSRITSRLKKHDRETKRRWTRYWKIVHRLL